MYMQSFKSYRKLHINNKRGFENLLYKPSVSGVMDKLDGRYISKAMIKKDNNHI